MGNSQMEDIGQIQAAEKPAKNKIASADQQSLSRPQVSGSGIDRSQHVEKNDQIADDVIYFHDDSDSRFQQRTKNLSSSKLKKVLNSGRCDHTRVRQLRGTPGFPSGQARIESQPTHRFGP